MMHQEKTRKSAVGYVWFRIWMLAGVGLAVLLLSNSVANYVFVSWRVLVEQIRREMAGQVGGLDQQMQQAGVVNTQQLAALLESTREKSEGKIAWILVRDAEGTMVAQTGLAAAPAFTPEYFRTRLRNRQPVFKTVETTQGEAVVEAFPFRLPWAVAPAVYRTVAAEAPIRGPRRAGMVEIAYLVRNADTALWPLRRNLMINCSAALALLVALAAMALRFRSYMEGKQLERQLAIARQVQQDLLPAARKPAKEFDLAAECIPAAGVGGDFYDVFSVNGDGEAFVLGDVSGKGMPAALLMGVIHGAVRSSAWTGSARQHEEATRRINRLLCEHASQERYASMFWSYFDRRSQLLRFVNAGHHAPLLFRGGEQGDSGAIRLSAGGPVMGLLANARYAQDEVRIEPGDTLVMYSDGIVEAPNGDGEEFGEERLAAIASANRDRAAEDLRDAVLASVRAFTGGAEPADDLTLLVVRFKNAASGEEEDSETEVVARAA